MTCETFEYVFTAVMRIATGNIQICSAPANIYVSDNYAMPLSRNNHNVSYVKRHSRHIRSVAISMLCSIYRPTITRDQGCTGAVINCIKLHLGCERKSEARYTVTTIDCVNKSLNNTDNVLHC